MAFTGWPEQNIRQPGTAEVNAARTDLAFHERMDIHELLNFKTVCMVKSKMESGLVFDQDLKAHLEKDVQQSMIAIEQLKSLYQAAPNLEHWEVER